MTCHCRSGSPDTCPECTDMETGEKFSDQDKTEAQRLYEATELLSEVRPTVMNATHDPTIAPWQKEVRQKLLARIDAFLDANPAAE